MNKTDTKNMKDDLRLKSDLINEGIVRGTVEMEQSKKELADLESQVPKLLALRYLGVIQKSEIAKARKRRPELPEFFQEYPFLWEGLRDQLISLGGMPMSLDQLERQAKRYEFLKTELQKDHQAHLGNELMGLGKELEC
jgi:hypothetical protein